MAGRENLQTMGGLGIHILKACSSAEEKAKNSHVTKAQTMGPSEWQRGIQHCQVLSMK